MNNIKIMIVDDSPFSRTILRETLREEGYDVVGEADSLESMLEMYFQCKPDIVTMDIAMPGADGFECSKVLRLRDPEAKIIIISSMKDAETEAEARRIGISGYVQKPVDNEVLKSVIQNVCAPNDLFENLNSYSSAVFKEALEQSIIRMTKTVPVVSEDEEKIKEYCSQGITVVIGIIGRFAGTMILDLSESTAEKMSEVILRRKPQNRDEYLAMGAEFANVIAGVACSMLNKKNKDFGLRVAPPSVFYGGQTEVISPYIQVKGLNAETEFGNVYLGIGFKKESVLWM